jgi:hypothetical protein
LAIGDRQALGPETLVIPTASFDLSFPREQVVPIVVWKIALISDVQHGSHLVAPTATMVGLTRGNAQ